MLKWWQEGRERWLDMRTMALIAEEDSAVTLEIDCNGLTSRSCPSYGSEYSLSKNFGPKMATNCNGSAARHAQSPNARIQRHSLMKTNVRWRFTAFHPISLPQQLLSRVQTVGCR